ncbi:hypothetical protein MLD38_003969 [Melastoma candidum]|uniref:Uncharacterized protein n=1 Tax=Melastoma candidum TaxID=119954 RepID=A0ACB9S4H6_9MYRT|nr:hypothetical protein MLD38_003969 [Melastoma candidum]
MVERLYKKRLFDTETSGLCCFDPAFNQAEKPKKKEVLLLFLLQRLLPILVNNIPTGVVVHGGGSPLRSLASPPHTSIPSPSSSPYCSCALLRSQTPSEYFYLPSVGFLSHGGLLLSDPRQQRFISPPSKNKRRRRWPLTRASPRAESPYEVLGVSPSATPDEIKRAYRRLALKFHPDVNKEANAQEKFMRIKHAYNTLLKSKDGRSGFSYSTSQRSGGSSTTTTPEDGFYGLEDFFRDLQDEFCNWESSVSSQGKPKSLWEELAEIGEEFVEFLEKELSITDLEDQTEPIYESPQNGDPGQDSARGNPNQNKDVKESSSIEDNIDEIEATLAQLKKQLGL